MSQASRNVSAIFLVLPAGSFAHSAGLDAESMRTTPYVRMPSSRSFLPIAHALRTCVRNVPAVLVARPSPSRRRSAATPARPASRRRSPSRAILSASRLRSSSRRVDADVRIEEKQIDAVELRRRSTLAPAVRSSIVSRSIGGSASGCPCRPGRATSRCEVAGFVRHGRPSCSLQT